MTLFAFHRLSLTCLLAWLTSGELRSVSKNIFYILYCCISDHLNGRALGIAWIAAKFRILAEELTIFRPFFYSRLLLCCVYFREVSPCACSYACPCWPCPCPCPFCCIRCVSTGRARSPSTCWTTTYSICQLSCVPRILSGNHWWKAL